MPLIALVAKHRKPEKQYRETVVEAAEKEDAVQTL
jgi:hypothetical protein